MSEKKTASDYVTEGDGFADIELSRPATIDGAPVSTIRMREPTAGDMENYASSSESESSREIGTFSHLCEIAPDEIRRLPIRDYVRLQAAFTGFTT